jgi:hypothetical protein
MKKKSEEGTRKIAEPVGGWRFERKKKRSY